MSISYNYFLPTNIYGTLRVTDLSFVGYTAVNANIYCQRNINCDGQLQCGQFHSLGTSYFDQVPTCISNATTATQLTNYQTVQGLITASGGITLQQAIDGVHTSILPFTAQQTINNNLIITNSTTTTSKTTISQNATTGQCTFTNQGNITGAYLFVGYNGATAINLLSINSSLCSITSTQINLNAVNLISLICTNTATFNGSFPTSTLGANTGLNNNEFATVAYVKTMSGSSLLALNNIWTGTNTFQQAITSSGANLTANTIPALSIVNNSITNSQIATGFQLVTTGTQTYTGSKTFSILLNTTGGILDSVNVSSPYFSATSLTSPSTFSIANIDTLNSTNILSPNGSINSLTVSNQITTSSIFTQSNLFFVKSNSTTIPITTNTTTGLQIGYNNAGVGNGQTDLINSSGLGIGGFNFINVSSSTNPLYFSSILPYANNGLRLYSSVGRLRIDDRNGSAYYLSQSQESAQLQMSINGGASTSLNILCNNASSVNSSCLTISTTAINALVPFSTTNATVSSNLFTNNINASASTPLTFAIGTVALPSGTNPNTGLQVGWNGTVGTGETNFINLGQGGSGGFQFGTITNTLTYSALCSINRYANQGLWLYSNCGRLRIDDRNGGAFWWGQSQEGSTMIMGPNGVSTSINFACGNASGVGSTCLTINSSSVSPNVNLNPLSTTTFNVSHPTTSLGNNISTNTTQYATVGFVNSNSATALLASNNIWTGTNGFTQRFIQVGNATQFINLGCGTGNIANVVIGDSSSLSTVSATAGNICISPPVTSSMYNATGGSSNICLGGSSATLLTSGNSNTFLGSGCGQTITTGSNNTIIGASAWSTGTANFSNCTVLGTNAPAPVANNSIVIGSSAEMVYIAGGSQLNNSLLYGTTVCSGDVLQVNNQIKRFHTVYTTGVNNTLINPLPFMILFTPIAGMGFVLPVPSATNAGQTFIIRRYATGGGQTINFTVTGGGAVFLPLNSGTAIANIAISTVWQFTFSTGSQYIAIA